VGVNPFPARAKPLRQTLKYIRRIAVSAIGTRVDLSYSQWPGIKNGHVTKPNVFTYVYEQNTVHKRSQRRLHLNLATRDRVRIFTLSEQVSTAFKIKVMITYELTQYDAIETALKANLITVADALEMGINEDALQRIENDKVNAAVVASK
jgi:hypothetical protein